MPFLAQEVYVQLASFPGRDDSTADSSTLIVLFNCLGTRLTCNLSGRPALGAVVSRNQTLRNRLAGETIGTGPECNDEKVEKL